MSSHTDHALGTAGNVPWTQAAVAVAFLKRRSAIMPTVRRKHVAASSGVFEDAMIEWHALREGAPGSID